MKLTWSAFALSDRDAIFTYIELENPSVAILVDERIVAAVRRLIDFPASGRVGRIAGTRELVINGTPYVALMPVDIVTSRRGERYLVLRSRARFPMNVPPAGN
ncbi:type II toxin-antitoxin system RelE/ParE family toxin [Rhizobium sp. RCC_161_2]|uniref:type II toxin-antitoxin system RelE/ParE family toxin n=1 Tax=Rhizobium sp. RCC_161_2 TaxID=3239219 RepID=UPI0035234331